jgi:hypothetical protein
MQETGEKESGQQTPSEKAELASTLSHGSPHNEI